MKAKQLNSRKDKKMLRIGAVSYLNTKPLIHGLEERLGDQGSLNLALPSQLADMLRSGVLDVALIPSVEYFRGAMDENAEYRVISNAAIACRGPVWSVRLLSRVPTKQIKLLAMDEGSRTSAAMVRILLSEMHGIQPATVPFPMDTSAESVDADAVLMIGDRAMHPERGVYQEIWDLGDRWCRHTELPFVFAMWVARMQPGDEVTLPDAPFVHVFVARGAVRLPDRQLDEGDAARLFEAGPIWVAADQESEIIVWESDSEVK